MNRIKSLICLFIIFFVTHAQATETNIELKRLQEGYPEMIQNVSPNYISWRDGTQTPIRGRFAFLEGFANLFRSAANKRESVSIKDLHCDSYEPFFKKMYGRSPADVKKNLVTIYWMPKVFGTRYPLKVTTVNGVDKKIRRISAALEKLPRYYFQYLVNPGGSFYWRNVASEKYLSSHSFGIAIDINSHRGNYWLWDWKKANRPARALTLHNNIPKRIVEIFEKEGFLWGGRWYFYDTMHFEYRPELFSKGGNSDLHYNNDLGLRCSS